MVSRSDSIERRLSEETSEPLSTGDTRQPKERKWHCFRENRQKDSVIKILNVVIVILIVLIITIIPCIVRSAVSGSVEKSNQMCSHANVSVPLVPPCTTGWIGYEGKCYFFSEEERNWTSGQRFCTSYDSSLALIESEREKVFMLRYKGKADHWIGLHKNLSQDWRWADGTEFNNTVEVRGEGGDCAFLSTDTAIVSRCYITRNWICNHPDAYSMKRNPTIR